MQRFRRITGLEQIAAEEEERSILSNLEYGKLILNCNCPDEIIADWCVDHGYHDLALWWLSPKIPV